jgi:hypothetical protein
VINALLVLGAGALMVWWLWRPLNIYDEGIILTGAQRLRAGEVLHADFWRIYPVGGFLGPLASMSLLGPNVVAGRIAGVAWRMVLVALLAVVSARLGGRTAAIWATVVAGIALGVTGAQIYPLHAATASLLIAVLLLSMTVRGDGRSRIAFAVLAGVATGLTGLFRQDLAVLAAILLAGVLALDAWLGRSSGSRQVLGGFSAAAALSGCLVLGGLVIWAGPGPVWDQLVDFPLTRMRAARSLPWPSPSLDDDAPLFYALGAAVLLVLALVITRAAKERATEGAEQRVFVGIGGLTAVLASLWVMSLQRFDGTHGTPAAVVAVALLAVLAGTAPPPMQRSRWALTGLAVVLSLVCLVGPVRSAVSEARNGSAARAGYVADCGQLPASTGCVPLPADQLAAIQEVDRRSAPGDRVFVGSTRASRAYYGDASFYFLSDRLPGTRYDEIHPGLTEGAAVQQQIIDDLEHNAVKVVVVADLPESDEPNLSSVDSGVALLDDYLRVNFHTVFQEGRYEVRVRN